MTWGKFLDAFVVVAVFGSVFVVVYGFTMRWLERTFPDRIEEP